MSFERKETRTGRVSAQGGTMANSLVKIFIDEDGLKVPKEDQRWCLADPSPQLDTERVLCSGQVLDIDTHAQWEEKITKRGGITCDKCLEAVRGYKQIKL